jgi:hypothetical protein
VTRGSDQIVAVPSVVRRWPPPVKKIIGDLANTGRALTGLDLRSAMAAQAGGADGFATGKYRSSPF